MSNLALKEDKSEFTSKAGLADDLGLSVGVIDGWQKRHWKNGKQYVVIGHQTLIHVPTVDLWIKQHGQLASVQEVTALELESGTEGSSSTPKRSRATRITKLT